MQRDLAIPATMIIRCCVITNQPFPTVPLRAIINPTPGKIKDWCLTEAVSVSPSIIPMAIQTLLAASAPSDLVGWRPRTTKKKEEHKQ